MVSDKVRSFRINRTTGRQAAGDDDERSWTCLCANATVFAEGEQPRAVLDRNAPTEVAMYSLRWRFIMQKPLCNELAG